MLLCYIHTQYMYVCIYIIIKDLGTFRGCFFINKSVMYMLSLLLHISLVLNTYLFGFLSLRIVYNLSIPSQLFSALFSLYLYNL